jgi:hypothetical protein
VPAVVAAAVAWAIWRRLPSLPVALFCGLAGWWLVSWVVRAV